MNQKYLYCKYLKEYLLTHEKPNKDQKEDFMNKIYEVEPLSFKNFKNKFKNKENLSDSENRVDEKINEEDIHHIEDCLYYYIIPGYLFYYTEEELVSFLDDLLKYGEIKDSKEIWNLPPLEHSENADVNVRKPTKWK